MPNVSGTGAATGALDGAATGTAILPGWGTAIGAGVGGIAGLFSGGGGGSQESGYSIPPEYEIQMLDQMHQQQQQVQQQMQQIQQLTDHYQSQITMYDQAIAGTMAPADVTQQISQGNANLIQQLGPAAQELMDNGFLSQDVSDTLKQMQGAVGGEQLGDPRLENQLKDQKRQLEQDLARQGVSPAQRAIALNQFDKAASEQRFTRSEELKTGITQRGQAYTNTSIGAQAQGLQNTFGMLGQQQNFLGFQQQGIGMQNQLAGQGYQAGTGALAMQQGLRGEQRDIYNNLGQYKLNRQTQYLIEAGAIGPGTGYQQTGIPLYGAKTYKENVQDAEFTDYGNRQGTPFKPYSGFGENMQYGGDPARAAEQRQELDNLYAQPKPRPQSAHQQQQSAPQQQVQQVATQQQMQTLRGSQGMGQVWTGQPDLSDLQRDNYSGNLASQGSGSIRQQLTNKKLGGQAKSDGQLQALGGAITTRFV